MILRDISSKFENPVFKNTLIYSVSGAFNAAIPFFLLPLLTSYLTPKEYGIASTFMVFNSIFLIAIGLEQQAFISVNFFSSSTKQIQQYVSNTLLISLTLFLVFFFGALIILFYTDEVNQISSKWIAFSVVVSLGQFLIQIHLTILQLKSRSIQYGIIQIANSLVSYVISIVLIIQFSMEGAGRIWGIVTAAVLLGITSFSYLVRNGYVSLKPDFQIVKSSLLFSLPLIPHGIAGWVNTGSDRLIINSTSGVADSGIYAAGFQVALMISLLASAFNKAFVPYIYNTLDEGKEHGKEKLVRYTYYYFIIIIAVTFFVSMLSEPILSFIADEKYYGANSYIYLIAIGFAADGLYYGVINYIFYSRKTSIISLITFSSCIIHLIISIVLIPRLGPIGAAYSTTISYLFTFILSWFLSNRVFPMPWFSYK